MNVWPFSAASGAVLEVSTIVGIDGSRASAAATLNPSAVPRLMSMITTSGEMSTNRERQLAARNVGHDVQALGPK